MSSSNSNAVDPQKAMPVAVIGATGKLGREVVQQLASRGMPVKCLIRQTAPPPYLAELSGVEFVKGDVGDVESLKLLLSGTKACLAVYGATRRSKIKDALPFADPESDPNHAKQVNYEGVKNILEAAKASKSCKRIIRITGDGEHPFGFFSILINLLGSYAKAWNYEGEQVMRNNPDIDYTIIRPGIMKQADKVTADSKTLALKDNGQPIKVAAIPYADIAELCIECMDCDNAARSTLTAMTVPEGEGEGTYAQLLKQVTPDSRQFPTSLIQEHRRAVTLGASILFGFLALSATGVVSLGRFIFSRLPF